MKIGLIVDSSLSHLFVESSINEEVVLYHSIKEIEDDISVLLADNKFIPDGALIRFIDNNKKTKCFYILSEKMNSIKKSLLLNKGVTLIPSTMPYNHIVRNVQNDLYEKDEAKDNIFVFLGADSKVGTSMVAQSLAETLSQNSNVKVLYAVFDGGPGMDYIQSSDWDQSLDIIKSKIMNDMISHNELTDICLKVDHLFFIQGTPSILNRKHYHPEHIETVLHQLAEIFDVVIVDIGWNMELGMTIGALNSSHHRFLICTQQNTCKSHFERVYSQILSQLDIKDFLLIVNKYINNTQLPNPHQLAEVYGASLICSVPYSEYGIQADIEKCTILNYREAAFADAIQEIAVLIEDALGIEKTEKKSHFKFFNKVFPFKDKQKQNI